MHVLATGFVDIHFKVQVASLFLYLVAMFDMLQEKG